MPTPTTPPAASRLPTIEAVEALIRTTESAEGLAEETRTRLLELHRQTLDQLRIAQDWAAKAADLSRLREGAPARLAEIRAELAQPATDPRPEPPAEASLAQLEQLMSQAQAELETQRSAAAQIDEEFNTRNARRREIPNLLAAARERLARLEPEPAPAERELPEVTQAREHLGQARRAAMEQEIRALEEEIASYDARSELLTARQDQARRRAQQAERWATAWQELVNQRRRIEAGQAARQAQATARDLAMAHPLLRDLAEANQQLVQRRTGPQGVAGRIERATAELEAINGLLARLRADLKSVKDRINAVGMNPAIGLLLRKQRSELPPTRRYGRSLRARQSLIPEIQYEILLLQEQRTGLADTRGRAEALVAQITSAPGPEEVARLTEAAVELLDAQRQFLEALINDLNSYFVRLLDLDARERELITLVEEYEDFIYEHVLWSRSAPAIGPGDLRKALTATRWLTQPRNWRDLLKTLGEDVAADWILYAVGVLGLALIVALGRRLRRGLGVEPAEADAAAESPYRAVGLALLTALAWPWLLGLIGLRLSRAIGATEFPRAVGNGLVLAAVLLATAQVPMRLYAAGGFAERSLRWPMRSSAFLRRQLFLFAAIGIPTLALSAALEAQMEETYKESLGRAAFVAGMLGLALVLQRLLRSRSPFMMVLARKDRSGLTARAKRLLLWGGAGLPVALAAAALAGYYYTALQLAGRIHATVCLGLVLVLVASLGRRWLTPILQRREAERVRRARRLAEAALADEGAGAEELPSPAPETEEVPPEQIALNVRRLARSSAVLVLAVGVFWIWAQVLPALGVFNRVELWSVMRRVSEPVPQPDGTQRNLMVDQLVPVTLGDLLLAAAILAGTILAIRASSIFFESLIFPRLRLDPGARSAMLTISQYILTLVGVVWALESLGISWSKLQWLVAAMGVGLGFGLQEIFANFVSGLIILFEQPIRVGDIVTVGDVSGRVTRIRIRATTVLDWNRRELIVPNKEFISGRVMNWTLTDPITRVVLPVGVAYGSDTEKVQEVLLQAARNHPQILDEPAPSALFTGFGDNALNFELRFFVSHRETVPNIIHDVHMAIDRAFRRDGLQIPFPQRDVHIDSLGPLQLEALEVRVVAEPEAGRKLQVVDLGPAGSPPSTPKAPPQPPA